MTAQSGDKTTGEVIGMPVANSITVALIPKVSEELQQLQKRTNLSKTDIANRAISLYEFIDAHLRADHELLILDKRTRKTQIVQIISPNTV